MTKSNQSAFNDPTTQPFWEAAHQHKLVAQYSPSARRYQFYPRLALAGTGETDLEWRELSGFGTIYSMTRVVRPLMMGIKVPYICVLVDLDEGVRLLSRVISPQCRIGDRVEVVWEPRGDAPPFPVFRVVES